MKRYMSLILVLLILAACSVPPGVPISGNATGYPATTIPSADNPAIGNTATASNGAAITSGATSSPTAPGAEPVNPPTVTPPAVTPTLVTTILVATTTPDQPQMGKCGYMWATKDLPEVTEKLMQAYTAAGLVDIQANAAAYGENCMDQTGTKVLSFSAMETDFYLLIPVKNRTDTQEMGDRLVKVLPVLDQFPVGQTPGPNPGYVAIRFKDDSGEQNLRFIRTKGQEAIQQGLTGSDLYNALATP